MKSTGSEKWLIRLSRFYVGTYNSWGQPRVNPSGILKIEIQVDNLSGAVAPL